MKFLLWLNSYINGCVRFIILLQLSSNWCTLEHINIVIESYKIQFENFFSSTNRYSAGAIPWGTTPGSTFGPQRHDDGFIEVIGFTTASLVSEAHRATMSHCLIITFLHISFASKILHEIIQSFRRTDYEDIWYKFERLHVMFIFIIHLFHLSLGGAAGRRSRWTTVSVSGGESHHHTSNTYASGRWTL